MRRKNDGGTLTHEMGIEQRKALNIVRYSNEERERQMQFIENLLARGLTIGQIVRAAGQPPEKGGLGIRKGRVHSVIAKVRERFAKEDEVSRPAWKSEQIRRLMRQLQVAMGTRNEKGEWTVMPNMSAYCRIEALIADVQGTREPLEVNVNVSYTTAMMQVIGTMTPEQMDRMLERARQRKLESEKYRALTVAGEAVE